METVKQIAEIEQRSKSNTRRIEVLEQGQVQLNELVTSVAVIAEKQNEMSGKISNIQDEVKQLVSKPAKRWESLIGYIIGAVVTALVSFLFFKIGMGV